MQSLIIITTMILVLNADANGDDGDGDAVYVGMWSSSHWRCVLWR